jgi:hypothetical protein
MHTYTFICIVIITNKDSIIKRDRDDKLAVPIFSEASKERKRYCDKT